MWCGTSFDIVCRCCCFDSLLMIIFPFIDLSDGDDGMCGVFLRAGWTDLSGQHACQLSSSSSLIHSSHSSLIVSSVAEVGSDRMTLLIITGRFDL